MKRRVGILTSGGDCPGLNATIRGVAKALYERIDDVEIVGVIDGYHGLINNDVREMKRRDFSGILTTGGTILGTCRTPYKLMRVVGDDNVDKVKEMKETYKKNKLDCLLTLGGNGTHKTANLLASEGLNVVGLPKTIDNDIFGTDVTFGFHTAVDIATEVIDRVHTTASSHKRVMVVEIMGNKVGWLTLYAGIAGGADIILIPEIPYCIESIASAIEKRASRKSSFSIVAVAEGAMSLEESKMKKKERAIYREQNGFTNIATSLSKDLQAKTGFETRVVIPGHIQRGGSPSAYDRVLATRFGVYAANLVEQGIFGVTVAMSNQQVVANPLADVAGKTKFVPLEDQMIDVANKVGISLGNK